jgi:hypothetical protein
MDTRIKMLEHSFTVQMASHRIVPRSRSGFDDVTDLNKTETNYVKRSNNVQDH